MGKRDNEDITAFTIRKILAEEAQACAKIAESLGAKYGEAAVGGAIATAIRQRHQD